MAEDNKKTLGENFLLELQQAATKGLLFAATKSYVKRLYPQSDILKVFARVSDFDAVVTYQAKLAIVRLEYNVRAIKEIHQRLVGLKNFGEDNYKYKEKIIRKLNLLINNHPSADDMVYMAMTAYIERGFGSAKDFKQEYKKWMSDEPHSEKLSGVG